MSKAIFMKKIFLNSANDLKTVIIMLLSQFNENINIVCPFLYMMYL